METTYKLNKEIEMSAAAPMYIYATEMTGTYYSILGLKDKSVLTICGSGDQAINACFFGAKKIVSFDLNRYCEHVLNLKIAAIKSLNYREFLEYFGEKNVNIGFDYSLYQKISVFLDQATKFFFDGRYKEFNNDGAKLVKSKCFRQRDDFSIMPATKVNNYLENEECYNRMRSILENKNIKFVQSDIKNIDYLAEGKFDIINLSNVPNYFVGHLGESEPLEYFYREILLKLRKLLFKKGRIFFYSYSDKSYPNRIASKIPLMSTKEGLDFLKSKKDLKVSQREFDGLNPGTMDRITILEFD